MVPLTPPTFDIVEQKGWPAEHVPVPKVQVAEQAASIRHCSEHVPWITRPYEGCDARYHRGCVRRAGKLDVWRLVTHVRSGRVLLDVRRDVNLGPTATRAVELIRFA